MAIFLSVKVAGNDHRRTRPLNCLVLIKPNERNLFLVVAAKENGNKMKTGNRIIRVSGRCK
jgi:hypothetical protein